MPTYPGADVFAQFLVDKGEAYRSPTSSQWGITTGDLPMTNVDNYLSVVDTGGLVDDPLPETGEKLHRPSVLVSIRSRRYQDGIAKAAGVVSKMEKVGKEYGWPLVVVNTVRYVIKSARLTVAPTKIGRDEENRREVFVLNARLTVGPG